MIDRTTLPVINTGESTAVGQRFTIQGANFNELPNELVISYLQSSVLSTQSGYAILVLVEKSNTEMVFEVTASHTFTRQEVFRYIATPFAAPRALVEYRLIG